MLGDGQGNLSEKLDLNPKVSMERQAFSEGADGLPPVAVRFAGSSRLAVDAIRQKESVFANIVRQTLDTTSENGGSPAST